MVVVSKVEGKHTMLVQNSLGLQPPLAVKEPTVVVVIGEHRFVCNVTSEVHKSGFSLLCLSQPPQSKHLNKTSQ